MGNGERLHFGNGDMEDIQTFILFGTVHVGHPSLEDLSEELVWLHGGVCRRLLDLDGDR